MPLDHPASNAGLAEDILGTGLGLPAANVHPWPVAAALARAGSPDDGGAGLCREVGATVPHDGHGDPIFDLLLLGVGPDGHVLSCFPGSPALAPDAPLTLGIAAPTHVEPHLARVTFRARVIGAARHVLVLAPGAAKADVLRRILEGPVDPAALPAQAGGRGAGDLAARPRRGGTPDRPTQST